MSNSRSSRGKVMLGGGSLSIAILLLGVQAWMSSSANPVLTIPASKLPSPNAYDDYAKAEHALAMVTVRGNRVKINYNTWMADGRYSHLYTPEERAALLTGNAEALALTRQGLTHPYGHPPIRGFKVKFDYDSYERLARLLLLDSEQKAARHQWGEAMEAALDTCQLGEVLPRGGGTSGLLFGRIVLRNGLRQVATLVPSLNAAQSLKAAQRLSDILVTYHVPMSEVLQEEKWKTQSKLLEIFQGPNSTQTLLTGFDPALWHSKETPLGRIQGLATLVFLNRKKVVADYTRYMDALIARARLPITPVQPLPRKPEDPISALMLPNIEDWPEKDAATQTVAAQMAMELALRAYWEKHHHYPGALSELLPDYLKRLPDDPRAATGTPFGYTRLGTGYSFSSQ